MPFTEIKATIRDFDSTQNVFVSSSDESIQLADDQKTTGLGEIVSSKAARKMIQNRFEAEIANPSAQGSETFAYDIGKESILMILLQEGCEGIRFIPCINPENNNSLVAMGIMSDQKPIKGANFALQKLNMPRSADDPIIIEKIGKTSVGSLIAEFDANPPSVPRSNSEKISDLTDKMLNII